MQVVNGDKQSWSWWGSAFCGFLSESSLFAEVAIIGWQGTVYFVNFQAQNNLSSIAFTLILQTDWTQIRPETSGLIWIQLVGHLDGIPDFFSKKLL